MVNTLSNILRSHALGLSYLKSSSDFLTCKAKKKSMDSIHYTYAIKMKQLLQRSTAIPGAEAPHGAS